MIKIVIIGGVAGGASAAARARRLSEEAEIIMLERGEFVSFANCGLPYHVSGDIKEKNKLLLQTPDSFLARFNVDVRVMNEVLKIDKNKKTLMIRDLKTQNEYEESYDFLILSPGACPIIPAIEGTQATEVKPYIHTLRNIPDMDAIINTLETKNVKHATVVGGGYIGLEMMEAFYQRGIKTTLLELSDQVMGSVDKEMASFAHAEMRAKGVDLRLKTALTGVNKSANDGLTLKLSDDTTIDTDILLLAIGVKPEVTLAKEAGLEIGALGGIWTRPSLQTSDPCIYAVGDAIEEMDFITGKPTIVPLAGPANRQGRIVANNIFAKSPKEVEHYQGTQATAICKIFDLAIASTGKNEKQLKAEQIDYQKIYVHVASHANYYPNAEIVSLKLLFSTEDGKILGAQAAGKDGVDKRIDILAVAQRAGMTIEQLKHVELSYAPPYGSAKDVINQAAFVACNIQKGDVKPIHYDEIDNLTDYQLILDVRTPQELENLGAIKGAINIPVDELRHRIHELQKNKEIIVYCQVGLRSHVAYNMLMHNGYNVRNLIGGYRTYHAFKNA